ncbi:MAG: HD domain-containing phosphohydrolase [Synechococcus sp. WH 8007]|nr:HD domain-containing phosphohydrolase [Synechococcus sp. WH 8007]
METDARADQTLVDILEIASAISAASDLRTLLHLILRKARAITSADAGSIFLVEKADPAPFWADSVDSGTADEEGDRLWFAVSQNASLDDGIEEQVFDIRFPITPDRLVGWCALHGEVLNLADVYALDPALPYQFDSSVDRQLGYRAVSMLTVPLRLASGEVVGVLQLINRKREPSAVITPDTAVGATKPFDAFDQQLIESLSSLAAVSVERTRLVEAQDRLIDSIISLLAGAIDAKSPYTGGHCERVPKLAVMLAEAAEAASEGPLAPFQLGSAEAWREFRTGAWLHDCGKLTTPEYVVDKATKLEMNGDRIHEIRTRFEVLWRDADIERLQGLLAGGDPDALDQALKERQQTLQEQFAFVAQCNLGTEFFDEAKIEALREIGSQHWMRHFDDSLGLAWEEQQRRQAHEPPSDALPAPQQLLMDQPWHCVPREQIDRHDPKHGFKVDVPDNLFNYGELHNLSISRGTLTEEERYKINDHIMQTIVMLDSLPFPPGLARVPEYAGTHHEALTGQGYPRRLAADRLSVPSRIMAIADIFEALTASDRPYKKAKPLSVSVEILAGFRDRGHIDPDLFDLFLTSGVYLTYAEQFLKPDQIDPVEIELYISGGAG